MTQFLGGPPLQTLRVETNSSDVEKSKTEFWWEELRR